jgi:hypothetical protein
VVAARGLSSFDHPADDDSSSQTRRKRSRNSEHGLALDALSCVIQKFFGSVAALLCGTPHCSDTIPDCVGDCVGCARGLVSRVGDVFRGSFHYRL